MEYVPFAKSVLNLRKWKAIISSRGARVVRQRLITAKCFANPAMGKKPINIEAGTGFYMKKCHHGASEIPH